jgi:hypothetical protein
VQLVAIVNQKQEIFTIGSPKNPLRSWLGANPSSAYDYDFQTHSWRPQG